jgi:hypothetical protein
MMDWVTKEYVDGLVQNRNVGWLKHLIHCGDKLKPEIREYLACVVADLLTGKLKFPNHRPKNTGRHKDKQAIAEKVWKALKTQGHSLPLKYADGHSRLVRGSHSVKTAVAKVAKEMHCSTTTVYNAWSGFDPWGYELQQEKYAHDAMMENYYDYLHDEAVKELKEEQGPDREFTRDEIVTRMDEIEEKAREDYRDYDDY